MPRGYSFILKDYIPDENIIWLLTKVVDSFRAENSKGLPLGNLTSQLFANVYLNEFDRFIKHKIKAKFYIRYADDFVILSDDRAWLENHVPVIKEFLWARLNLEVHPNKLFIETTSSGVDFLGWINFPGYRVLRRATRIRMFRKLKENNYKEESLNSYLGMIGHGDAFKIKKELLSKCTINHNFN